MSRPSQPYGAHLERTEDSSAVQWGQALDDLRNALGALSCTDGDGRVIAAGEAFARWCDLAGAVRLRDKTLYLVGNGASASMASHFAADLAKNAGIRAQVFTDLSQITAISNDIGFDQIYAVPLERYARPGDMLIAISSSGNSPNIVAAVEAARQREVCVVTLSGFGLDNALRRLGSLNFHVPAPTYGLAETCHAAILHHWMDRLAL